MDVNATLKMNDMVKNLTKHGIISNSEEAMEIASKMYNVRKNDDELKVEIEVTEQQKIKDELKSMIDKRLQYFLEKHNSMMCREFQEIWTKMNQIGPHFESRIEQMRSEMQALSMQKTGYSDQAVNNSAGRQVIQKAGQEGKDIKQETAKGNPRSGKFQDDDVSVEKFFYFGQK